MKRSGFKRLTYAEIIAKQDAARERARKRAAEKSKLPKPPREKKPKKKLTPVQSLKQRVWVAFSRYIRRKYADRNGMVMTCDGQFLHWKQTDCGHLFHNTERNSSLGGNLLWYYENNFAPQSRNGNYFNANDSAKEYMRWAIARYGQIEVDRMARMKQQRYEFTEAELEEKLQYYRQEFAKMEA